MKRGHIRPPLHQAKLWARLFYYASFVGLTDRRKGNAPCVSTERNQLGYAMGPQRFLTEKKARWADIERHVCFIADLVGPEYVALGPDFIDFSPEEIARSLSKSTVDYGEDCSYPSGFSDDRCFRDIATHLGRAGFNDDEIAGIMGENILRVVEDVERSSTKG